MEFNDTFSLLFSVRKNRERNGMVPLVARLTINGKREQFSLNSKIQLKKWDVNKQRSTGRTTEDLRLNSSLDKLSSRIHEIFYQLVDEKKIVSSKKVLAILNGKKIEKTLLTLFDYHNKSNQGKLNAATLKHYKASQNYLVRFIKETYQSEDMMLTELNYEFISSFEHYLRHVYLEDRKKPFSNNTIMKHIQRLRKMVTMAHHLEWIPNDPFVRFKYSIEKKSREYLSQNELYLFHEYKFANPRLELVSDLYIFSCYTGISFSDIMNLTRDNLVLGMDGGNWINFKRIKTKTLVKVPVLQNIESLIDKYSQDPRAEINGTLFPKISNQKTNAYLKEIGEILGIKKSLTFHMARHTFATTVTLSNGVPIETVSKLLGHTKIATTQIYARVLEEKLSQDMGNLSDKLFSKNKKPNSLSS